jgi:hypothetical protein
MQFFAASEELPCHLIAWPFVKVPSGGSRRLAL